MMPDGREAPTASAKATGGAGNRRTAHPNGKRTRPSPDREMADKLPRQNGHRKPPRQPWEPREPRRRPDPDDRVPTPVGLGDHVPAFLRKTTRTQ